MDADKKRQIEVKDSHELVPDENLTWWQRYDHWAWSSGPIMRAQKVKNAIKGSSLINSNFKALMIYRICAACIYTVVWCHNARHELPEYHFFSL